MAKFEKLINNNKKFNKKWKYFSGKSRAFQLNTILRKFTFIV